MSGTGFEFSVAEKDIKERIRFGGFELLRTDNGIMYRNNAGFHLWCAPYVAGLDGKAKETSLYSALSFLMRSTQEEPEWVSVEGGGVTGRQIREALSLAVQCSCTWPLTAFSETNTSAADFFGIDIDWLPEKERADFSMPTPYFFAKRFMEYLTRQGEALLSRSEATDEDADADARILVEDMAAIERSETLAEIAKERDGAGAEP